MVAKKFHHYVVTGVLPALKNYGTATEWRFRRTYRWGVVSTTPELAGMQVRLSHPDAVIDSISHRGVIDFFHEAAHEAGAALAWGAMGDES